MRPIALPGQSRVEHSYSTPVLRSDVRRLRLLGQKNSNIPSPAFELQLRVGVSIDFAAQINFFELWCCPRHRFCPLRQLRSSEYKSIQSGCPEFPDNDTPSCPATHVGITLSSACRNCPALITPGVSPALTGHSPKPAPNFAFSLPQALISGRIGQPEQQFRNPTLRFRVTAVPVPIHVCLGGPNHAMDTAHI